MLLHAAKSSIRESAEDIDRRSLVQRDERVGEMLLIDSCERKKGRRQLALLSRRHERFASDLRINIGCFVVVGHGRHRQDVVRYANHRFSSAGREGDAGRVDIGEDLVASAFRSELR